MGATPRRHHEAQAWTVGLEQVAGSIPPIIPYRNHLGMVAKCGETWSEFIFVLRLDRGPLWWAAFFQRFGSQCYGAACSACARSTARA